MSAPGDYDWSTARGWEMPTSKQLHLTAFMRPVSLHTGAWRYPGSYPDANFNLAHLKSFIQKLEAAKFDAFFMADHLAVLNMPTEALKRSHTTTSFEPFTLLSALSQVTERIGLAATASTTYDEPYHIARRFASLDHLSNGRAAWNIVTTGNPESSKNFGQDEHMQHNDRYKRAREFYDVVTGLWDSFADDAFVRDQESGTYLDPDKMHVLNHSGDELKVRGPLNIGRPVQGWPELKLEHVGLVHGGGIGKSLADEEAKGGVVTMEASSEQLVNCLRLVVSSAENTIWSVYHTANTTGNGTAEIDGSSVYRIASNTKIFTAMAILQQHAQGKINLDSPITQYVPDLASSGHSQIEWNRISVRSLMSQFGGLQDNYAQEDLLAVGGASALGLPPVSDATAESLPACELNSTLICTPAGLLDNLATSLPVFPPHQQSSYSNAGYDLLGLAIENVTGKAYEEYVTCNILKPLGLNATTFVAPSRTTGAIPAGENQWGANLGVGNAAGGIYSSSNDMTRFLRYILNNYNNISPTINWFSPLTYSTGSHNFFGAPWEIFRTTAILTETNRPVTILTKGGGLDGYYSYSLVIPDYNLVVSILLAGDLGGLDPLLGVINTPLIQAVQALAQNDLKQSYAGNYAATNLNSSIILAQTPSQSLHVTSWISNGTDVLVPLTEFVAIQAGQGSDIYYQLIPTFETRYKSQQVGEVWRFINVLDTPAETNTTSDIWNDYCVANFDPISYGGKPLTEVVFWKDGGVVKDVELSAFRVVMAKK
ncbi:hypothetical protein B0A55_01358 [Friedmanniomyces simplex]|uniref:Luciferase-like domain-containing protein n=1 Tax=Friedmanniomyces simplex TaxID=329884 RepID=A0A4U0Y0X1_9PEZI|nr:hypothetical protein B0A55_01358 [Friedmanniomyces simplex]